LEGLGRRLWLKGNGLQLNKSLKTGKTRKKVQNSFRRTPVILQNAPIFPPKTGHDERHDLQVVAFVRVIQRYYGRERSLQKPGIGPGFSTGCATNPVLIVTVKFNRT
jgi:hypothetical protein